MLVYRPVGAYGVPLQYERSFRWKLGQFRYLCSVSGLISCHLLQSIDDSSGKIMCM